MNWVQTLLVAMTVSMTWHTGQHSTARIRSSRCFACPFHHAGRHHQLAHGASGSHHQTRVLLLVLQAALERYMQELKAAFVNPETLSVVASLLIGPLLCHPRMTERQTLVVQLVGGTTMSRMSRG
jgi:hypothetical protein